jgi:L-galactose dehydrogenase
MHYRTLGRTALRVSELGFGAAPLGNEYGPADPHEGERAVACAIDLGINFFDVAPYYGRTIGETRLGEALKGRRDKVILGTKCARYDVDVFDFSAEGVAMSAEDSLRRLQTDYIDILHVHDIEFGDRRQIIEETVPALRRLQTAGKVRFVGITGLALKMLREVIEAVDIDCVLSYCRYNLLNRDLDDALAPSANARGVGLISASPLHMGLLRDSPPPDWHPAPEPVKDAARSVAALCRARGHSPSDVALQFAISHPTIASTFVGLANPAEVMANLKALEGRLDPDLLKEIDALTAPVHRLMWVTGRPENH